MLHGLNFEDRQITVHHPDLSPDCVCHVLWVGTSSDHQRHRTNIRPQAKWLITVQEVHFWILVPPWAVILDIRHDTHDRKPGRIRFEPDPFAYHVFARPEV